MNDLKEKYLELYDKYSELVSYVQDVSDRLVTDCSDRDEARDIGYSLNSFAVYHDDVSFKHWQYILNELKDV